MATWSLRRAAGAQFAAELGARSFDQAAFEGGVHVLVGDGRGERAGFDVGFEHVQRGQHRCEFVVVSRPALCRTRACAREPAMS